MARTHLSGQRPWIVQLFDGPVDGLVSQNWVCRSNPCVRKQRQYDTPKAKQRGNVLLGTRSSKSPPPSRGTTQCPSSSSQS